MQMNRADQFKQELRVLAAQKIELKRENAQLNRLECVSSYKYLGVLQPFRVFQPFRVCLNRLECVSFYKYLGVLLCSNLSWSPHIKSVCSKSRKVLGTIFRHFYQFSSPKTLLCLYRALVLPHLSYCSSV